MATMIPSKYQKVVYTYILKGHGNAVIDAVAGSGKSTTIVNALKLIPSNEQVLFLAFNKSIVEELKIKIGNLSNVDIKTLHGLGATAIKKALKSELLDEKYKVWLNNGVNYQILSPLVGLNSESMSIWKQNILKLIDLGRCNLVSNVQELEELSIKHNLDILDNECAIAYRGIKWGVSETHNIDFTDMIYFPNVKDVNLPKYDWVFIDECQDLNSAQRGMFLKCLKPNGRFIAVGDPRQAIYGFAGADANSFQILKSLPHTAKLPLSVCYRCDATIIEEAKKIVPQIQCRDNAPSGEINRDSKINDIKDGDMVLCRISAPLVKLCMQYIGDGVKAYVKGRDIGANLINMIKKTNAVKIDDAIAKIEKELDKLVPKIMKKQGCNENEAKETNMYVTLKDKKEAIAFLSEGLSSSKEVIDRISMIFSDENKSGICLSTIHKAKGLESDRVFIICEDKLYLKACMKVDWMAEQEKNLVYVAITRARHFLGFVKDFKY